MEELTCHRCGLVNDYRTQPNGPHTEAICNGCDKHIKFVSKPDEDPVIYFGKYSQSKISSITDLNYLELLVKNVPTLKDKLRAACEKQITKLKGA